MGRTIAIVAACGFVSSPLTAAPTGDGWISICTAWGPRSIFFPGAPVVPADPRHDPGHGMCAHATCAREFGLGKKPRASR